MHYTFESSHVSGEYPAGRLTVGVRWTADATGEAFDDELFFGVPGDFHVRNDLVATALMTLVGTRATSVTFNFPISRACAETLRAYYQRLEALGPVDDRLEPRAPGKRIGLNFSGGIDSTAIWYVLQEALDGDFAVITSQYHDYTPSEEAGVTRFHRDVDCWTNIRTRRFDRAGRFNGAVPLLFADYLDLGLLATGHVYTQEPPTIEALWSGRPPRFLELDLAFSAAGVSELQVARMLGVFATMLILVTLAPESIEDAFAASSGPATEKNLTNGMLLRRVFERQGIPRPPYLEDLQPVPEPLPFGLRLETDMRLLQIAKWEGIPAVRELCRQLRHVDLLIAHELSLNFLWRYHPDLARLLPPGLRERVLAIYHRCGVLPFDETDFLELERVRRFLARARVRYDPSPSESVPAVNRRRPAPARPSG